MCLVIRRDRPTFSSSNSVGAISIHCRLLYLSVLKLRRFRLRETLIAVGPATLRISDTIHEILYLGNLRSIYFLFFNLACFSLFSSSLSCPPSTAFSHRRTRPLQLGSYSWFLNPGYSAPQIPIALIVAQKLLPCNPSNSNRTISELNILEGSSNHLHHSATVV